MSCQTGNETINDFVDSLKCTKPIAVEVVIEVNIALILFGKVCDPRDAARL